MKGRAYLLISLAILIAGGAHLLTVDYGRALDTDVASLLPQDESPAARLLRSLVSDQQGRLVYFALELRDGSDEAAARAQDLVLDRFGQSGALSRAGSMEGEAAAAPYRAVFERRMSLLFPKWLAATRSNFAAQSLPESEFPSWAAERAVEEFNAFLESPAAMELARPELIDPLLLAVRALEELSASGETAASQPVGAGSVRLLWGELAGSPLAAAHQQSLEELVASTERELQAAFPEAELRYGGLARLAGASRARIQSDIAKINLVSLALVLLICLALVRPPWRFLYALPVVAVAFVGAASLTLLVFGTVNIIVLVIGSILIGTAIDYAFHTLFAKSDEAGFPTRKLLRFACLSTIVGFGILLLSDMALIRQVGVFVASGLLFAFIGSQSLVGLVAGAPSPRWTLGVRLPRSLALLACAGVAGVSLLGFAVSQDPMWQDDIRNLEAPDPKVVEEDLALRSLFGGGGDPQVALSLGSSYGEALESQNELLEALADREAGPRGLIASRLLATASEARLLERDRAVLRTLFAALEQAFEEAGYSEDAFSGFFEEARVFAEREATAAEVEAALAAFAATLEGPTTALLDSDGQQFWTAASLEGAAGSLQESVRSTTNSMLLSQLEILNQSLDTVRVKMGIFGSVAMGAVAIAMLLAFGLRWGALIVVLPLIAGFFAVAVASLFFEQLNLFHLIGCFLGGTIALDYALFGVESMKRGETVPYSVWLSAATTGASFLALTSSYIPAVRALGLVVSIITLTTILLLLSAMAFFWPAAKTSIPAP